MLYLMGLREPLGEIGSGPPYSVGNGEVVDLGSRRDMARNVGPERGAVGVWGLLTGPGWVGDTHGPGDRGSQEPYRWDGGSSVE